MPISGRIIIDVLNICPKIQRPITISTIYNYEIIN